MRAKDCNRRTASANVEHDEPAIPNAAVSIEDNDLPNWSSVGTAAANQGETNIVTDAISKEGRSGYRITSDQ